MAASSTKTIWLLAQERLHKSSFLTFFAAIPEFLSQKQRSPPQYFQQSILPKK
jgi:hypothetical protein